MIEQTIDETDAGSSRRGFLKVIALAGASIAGAEMFGKAAFAQSATTTAADTAQDILNIAATAEALAVAFYSSAIAAGPALKISDDDLNYLQAALVQEQIHENFLVANGAKPLTTTFSFPNGATTFSDIGTLVSTLEALETAFVSAYNAAVYEFAQMGQHDLARVAGMIGSVEAQHFALIRDIGGDFDIANSSPPNNWGFAPQVVSSVGNAATVLTTSKFLSPATGNSYGYTAADLTSGAIGAVAASVMYQTPFVASAGTGNSGAPGVTSLSGTISTLNATSMTVVSDGNSTVIAFGPDTKYYFRSGLLTGKVYLNSGLAVKVDYVTSGGANVAQAIYVS
jgi:hypothetical protein